MLQPFILLEQKHIDELEKVGKTFLVSQQYYLGANYQQRDDDKIDILVTDYPNRGLADIHYNAKRGNKIKGTEDIIEAAAMIEHDLKFTSVIDLKNINHYQTLQKMLEGDKYRVYWAVTIDNEKVRNVIRTVYADKIYRYIIHHLKWPMKGNDTLVIKEGVIFGELFVNLKWNNYKKRIPLADIQQYKVL